VPAAAQSAVHFGGRPICIGADLLCARAMIGA
jgi:hypothetical protein